MKIVTIPESGLDMIREMGKRLAKLERLFGDSVQTKSDWITPEQIEDEFGIKPRTISQARYDGRLTKFKCSKGWRNFKYSRKEIEQKMFMKVA